jgi:hypothetical protein
LFRTAAIALNALLSSIYGDHIMLSFAYGAQILDIAVLGCWILRHWTLQYWGVGHYGIWVLCIAVLGFYWISPLTPSTRDLYIAMLRPYTLRRWGFVGSLLWYQALGYILHFHWSLLHASDFYLQSLQFRQWRNNEGAAYQFSSTFPLRPSCWQSRTSSIPTPEKLHCLRQVERLK